MAPTTTVTIARFALAVALAGALAGAPARAAEVPPIAAAADLQFALPEIVAGFHATTGLEVRATYGSSGNFTRQIEQGAPFELFLSADESYVDQLAERGLTIGRGALYALGRIVLFAPRGSPLDPDRGLAALTDPSVTRFAIANPEHAPYGRAAREALVAAGIWGQIRSHLVIGENAAQAASFAASGSTAGGIIPLALAIAPAFASAGRYKLIDAALHRPLRQRMVLLVGAGATARRLFEYLRSPAARGVLERYGFEPPR